MHFINVNPNAVIAGWSSVGDTDTGVYHFFKSMIAINPIAKQGFMPIASEIQQSSFEVLVKSRLGVVPNAFKGDNGSFKIKEKLWELTEFSYIDNPLPSLFKERLFVYLSTFCKTRYCLVRHVGFLTGLGYPSGDRLCKPQPVEEVLQLLQFKLPMGIELNSYVSFCLAHHKEYPVQQVQSNSHAEQAIFSCAAHIFLRSDKSTDSSMALKKILGDTQFEWLIVLLNFIHSTHLNASVSPDLFFEEDVIAMMHAYKQIAASLLKAPEIYPAAFTQQMLDELALLQTNARKNKNLQQDYHSLVKQHGNLHKKQKQQETALQQMKELQHHAALMELIHDPVIVWSLDGRVVIWNTGAQKHYGFIKEEAVGQVIHTLLQTNAAMPADEIINTVIKKKEWCGELTHTLKNGKTIVVESRQRLFKSAGKAFILETNHDITARKQAEEALRKSEERLQLAASVAGFGVHDADLTTNNIYWSPELKTIYGVEADAEITSEVAANHIHPDDRSDVLEEIAQLMKPENSGEFEKDFRIRQTNTGKTRWLHSRSRVTYSDIEGIRTPVRYTGVCIDVTERRQAQEQLRLSEEKYRTLFESIDEGFCIIEMLFDAAEQPIDYRFVDMNPAFERQTGILNGKGKTIRQIAPQHEQHWLDTYGQVATTGQPVRFQNKAKALNRHYDAYAFKFGSKEEKKVAVLFKDITQQKAMEQQREEFLGIASHELKTPVTSIKAYAEILQEIFQETGDNGSTAMMSKLNTQVDRLSNLIRTLLDTTRLAEGHLQLKQENFDLNSLIAEKAEELQRLTTRHRIYWQHPKVDNRISADKEKIGQVLTNLLSNAIKYSPKGGDVCINCQNEANQVVINVQDCGLGITEEMQARIFDRFYRVSHSQTSTISGLGLGLYITAGIVQQHGGTIRVKSQPGRGSVFSFALPC